MFVFSLLEVCGQLIILHRMDQKFYMGCPSISSQASESVLLGEQAVARYGERDFAFRVLLIGGLR